MEIGAISFQPYVYNTNQIDATSMSRVPAIPGDINAEGTDYSGLVNRGENSNPLRPGETMNFADIIGEQMSRARFNAERVMPAEEDDAIEVASRTVQAEDDDSAMEALANRNGEVADEKIKTAFAQEDELAAEMADQVREDAAATEVEEEDSAEAYQAVTTEEQVAAGNFTSMVSYDGIVSGYPQGSVPEDQVENFELETGIPGKEMLGETVFANIIPEGMVHLPYDNMIVESTQENVASPAAEQSQPNQMTNLYQMRRATDAYAMAMGL
jgi:hypothetical protein